MKIEVMLSTEYINDYNILCELDKHLIESTKKDILEVILEYTTGAIEYEVSGYYKSKRNIITKSTYINLVFYTDSSELKSILLDSDYLVKIRNILRQESLTLIIDNEIYFK